MNATVEAKAFARSIEQIIQQRLDSLGEFARFTFLQELSTVTNLVQGEMLSMTHDEEGQEIEVFNAF